jgi:branched-chain amino acid transport system substrate-binding protein
MRPPFTIGFLTPYSGIYPYYSSHLVTGWLLGMGLDPARQRTVQFVPEYTQMGGADASLAAAKKLNFFNRVDLLSGLVSYKAAPGLIPLVENEKKPAFFFDMGEYIPHFPYLSNDVFYASHQLWQSEYALGEWAQRTYGSGGHLVMPVYEAGYHLHSAFLQGISAVAESQVHMTILPLDQQDPGKMELDNFFAALAKNKPPYVHAIFAGDMGTRFMEKWIESGYHKKIPLLVIETMIYDDILADISHKDVELYSAVQWMKEDENKANKQFVKKFESIAQQPANIYALMGYEAGLIWKELLPSAQKRDWDTVRKQLKEGVINGPRGPRNFYPSSGFALPVTNIIKVSTSASKIHKIILDQGKGLRYDAQVFEKIHNESVSGWQNPFLCI